MRQDPMSECQNAFRRQTRQTLVVIDGYDFKRNYESRADAPLMAYEKCKSVP